MADLKGKTFQEMVKRNPVGRPRIFETPADLEEACDEYIAWAEANPLESEHLFNHQGKIVRGKQYHPQAMTIDAMCAFINICHKTWRNYATNEEFLQVAARVEAQISRQKFTGAAAGLLKENIIAREMGIADKKQVDNTHRFEGMSDEELKRKREMLQREIEEG
jgi:hypothetical protein